MLKHRKTYMDDLKEFQRRFRIWSDNLQYIVEHNKKSKSHWLGLNSMADLSLEEYRQYYLGFNQSLKRDTLRSTPFRYADVDVSMLPTAIDWREKGAVTDVKNQQQCGSCWAFSTTGSVEGINAIVTSELLALSEQELVDCDTNGDNGCYGGFMDNAFGFIIQNGGIDTEDDYPYTAQDGVCMNNKLTRKVVTIDAFEDVPSNSEADLQKALANQPVSVAIEADHRSFQLYAGGVYDDPTCGTQLDHGVLAVGYGVDETAGSYWIVKNSWSEYWGDGGYINLKMGVQKEGLCGIAMVASYPVKTHPNPPKPPPTPPGPDPDAPVDCDGSVECPAQNTCCCLRSVFGYCSTWGCCPLVNAVCCDDHEHCCPEDRPVCDTYAGRCLQKMGTFENSVPWSTKTRAQRRSKKSGRSGLPWF